MPKAHPPWEGRPSARELYLKTGDGRREIRKQLKFLLKRET